MRLRQEQLTLPAPQMPQAWHNQNNILLALKADDTDEEKVYVFEMSPSEASCLLSVLYFAVFDLWCWENQEMLHV